MRCLCARWVWVEGEWGPALAETLGVTCQTLEDRPVDVSVTILVAIVGTQRLASCPGSLALPPFPRPFLRAGWDVCTGSWPYFPWHFWDPMALTPKGLFFLFWGLSCGVGAGPDLVPSLV